MSGAFRDRVVVVTGAGAGIGRALASAFYNEGAKVAIASRDPERLKKAATVIAARSHRGAPAAGIPGELMPARLDVRLPQAVAAVVSRIVETWGRVEILVNSARVSGTDPIDGAGEDPDRAWLEIVDTQLNGVYRMTRACLPHFPAGGRIINVCCEPGSPGTPGYLACRASRDAVIGLTRALAAELVPRRVTVNAICPGEPATARPEEAVPLALHLASAAAASVTGRAIGLDGEEVAG